MNTLTKMLRDVYGVTDGVREAPPRPAMKRFGGTFDPNTLQRATCRLLQPPFVSYCMIVEEHVGSDVSMQQPQTVLASEMEVEDADGLDEPPPPALFDSFLTTRGEQCRGGGHTRRGETSGRKREGGGTSGAPAPAAKRTRAPGPMSKFFK
tara:strand:- start:447 stop:899 length:453 start_codon:yes stop_codon:yes gene_type:complete